MKKKSKVILLTIIFILVVIIGLRFNYINNKYPKAPVEAYNLGDTIEYRGIKVKVEKAKFISDNEIKNMNLEESTFFENAERKAIVATVNFKNTSNENQSIECDFFEAESIDWHNGLNYEMFTVMNGKEASPSLTLAPNEEITLDLPYEMFDFQYNSSGWKKIEEVQFSLTLDIYPVKKCVKLQI
ncbi:MAG: hypothetical protein RSA29_14720 [Clostridium sp.]|uniref:hypothetical protein n=1 Tax=Clostridium sp. TaxID=1506 RepID=UPI0032168F54